MKRTPGRFLLKVAEFVFDDDVRSRVRKRYIDAISPWREGQSYRLPGEFVVVAAKS